MIRTEHQIEMDRYVAIEQAYKPTILDALKNTLRCAAEDACKAQHAYDLAKKRLGVANRAKVQGDGFVEGRKAQQIEALREMNKVRAILRHRMAVFNAAWDALKLWPGVGDSVIRQMH